MALNKDAFLAKGKLKVIEVEIPELDGEKIKLQELSTKQAREFLVDLKAAEKTGDNGAYLTLTVKVFVVCALNDDGSRMFADDEVESVIDILPMHVASRLGLEALKHSKLTDESKKEAHEEQAKNSETLSIDSVSA